MAEKRRNKFYLELFFLSTVFIFSLFVLINSITSIKEKNNYYSEKIKEKSTELITAMKLVNPAINYEKFPFYEDLLGDLKIVAGGWFLGNKKIWSFPKDFDFPYFEEPQKGIVKVVSYKLDGKILTFKVEDGRSGVVIFKTKGLKEEWLKLLLICLLTIILSLFAIILFFANLKMKSEGDFLKVKPKESELTPFETINVFKKTIAELREKCYSLEAELKKEKKKSKGTASVLENLSSGLNTGFMRFDKEGNLQAFNPIAKSLFGLPILFRIGESYKRLFLNQQELVQIIERSLREKEILTGEEIKGFKGKQLFILSIPVLDELSHLDGVLLIIQDNTALYEMKRILREKESLSRIGEVASVVAHEVRNGLSVLSGELRLLKKESGDSVSKRVKRIEEEILKMEKVVKDLLYYSKPLSLEKSQIYTNQFCDELISTLKESFYDVEFDYNFSVDSFKGDKDALLRALFNLLKNSAEASNRVYLEIFKKENKIIFHIEDDGEGLSEEATKTLFTPFISQKKDGTGLGIPIAKKIATEHKGDLELCKPKKLKGAAFNFIIED